MTTRELRASIFEDLNFLLDDEEAMCQLKNYLEELKKKTVKSPCAYTLDKVKQRLRNTEKDAIAGRGLTTEEVMAQSEEWV
ncbi:MAG: hypothetical protein LUE99_14480 [Bacteroides sp.]|nr:hypothetical protein [Bacteroides sp.]